MRFRTRLALAGITLALATAAPASADIIVNTGLPADFSEGGSALGDGQWSGVLFSTGATTITLVQGAIGQFAGTTFHIALYESAGDSLGPELYSVQASYFEPGWNGSEVVWPVAAGNYFLTFEVRDGDDFVGFMATPSPNPQPIAAARNSANPNWVIGPSSETGQYGILILADAGVGTGVPEPASWAMLIAGLGLTGAMLRQRRRAVA